ncbi:MAG: hypothetical protein ACYDBQ_12740, partial [Thermoplasmatota archaeon]
ALRGALTTANAANGLVDYQEAQTSLGMAAGGTTGFHIRMYPRAMLGLEHYADLSKIHTAYIGEWASLATVHVNLNGNVTVPMPCTRCAPRAFAPVPTVQTQLTIIDNLAQVQLNTSMFTATRSERTELTDLGLQYTDRIYITPYLPVVLVSDNLDVSPTGDLAQEPLSAYTLQPLNSGDLYPDNKQYLDGVLPGRLPSYQVLVVGSGVDQTALNDAAVKNAITSWVMGGGELIVLGTDKQSYNWLMPMFGAGVSTVNGAAVAPDPTSPLLIDPHVLAWTSYNSHGFAWDLKDHGQNNGQGTDAFNHVVLQGGEDVLAISKDGAFGKGRVTLTSYFPREIAQNVSKQEAENFLDNIILYSDRSNLYLEYGPMAPRDQPVAVAVRASYLWDSKLGQVPVTVEVEEWGAK